VDALRELVVRPGEPSGGGHVADELGERLDRPATSDNLFEQRVRKRSQV